VMSLFNTIPRTKRSHGHKRIQHPNVKKSSKPRTLEDTFNDLLSNIQKPLMFDEFHQHTKVHRKTVWSSVKFA
jgi:hypothetical protein